MFGNLSYHRFPRRDHSAFMSGVKCYGQEDSLFQCENDGWRVHDVETCSYENGTEAGVVCFNEGTYTKY